MKPKFSTTFRSQMVGKPERVNEVLTQYLTNLVGVNEVLNQYSRNLVGVDQRDWAEYVDQAKFCCNIAVHLATKGSSFVVACGVRSNLLT
jgi:hypothetical protein